jgi:hypothetical protein
MNTTSTTNTTNTTNTTSTINNKTIDEKEPLLNQENQEKLYPDLDNLTNNPENTEPKETTQLIDYTEPKNNKSIYNNCIYVFPFIIFLIIIISILQFKK